MQMTAARTINRPAAEVFHFFSDASNNPRWQKGMVSCTWSTEPPIGRGSEYTQHARFAGRDVVSEFVVTEFEPGRLIEIATTKSTFPIRVRRSVEAIDENSCQVTAEISGGPTGRARFLEPLLRRMAQRSVDADYDRLKLLLEDGG